MSFGDDPEPADLLGLARAGGGPDLGQLLEHYRGYLMLLARVGEAAFHVLNHQENKALALITDPDDDTRRAAARKRFDQPFFTEGFQITMFLLLFIGAIPLIVCAVLPAKPGSFWVRHFCDADKNERSRLRYSQRTWFRNAERRLATWTRLPKRGRLNL